MTEPLLDASAIAKVLGVSARQVKNRYAMMPDFPKPVRLPSLKGKGRCRWKREDIDEWIDSLQAAA